MSRPINELSKFRSYSYYHVLALCDSSQTAAALSSSESLDVWQHPTTTEGPSPLSKYSPKRVSENTPGKYIVLINGSTDATFVITKAKWTSFTASSATMNDRNTSISLEGSISISEPRGVMFLDQVVRSCLQLEVDSANAFWVLKTFFVGYTHDDEVEYITNIPPIVFIVYDVVGTFNNVGGEYEVQFLAAANSAARLPHFSKAMHAINLKADGTLYGTFQKLADEVNSNYDKYFKCVEQQIRAIPGSDDLVGSLRRVKYTIDCDDVYKNATGLSSNTGSTYYTVTDQAAQLKDRADCNESSNIHISAGISIEDAIHRIMGMCPQVKLEANQSGIKYTYKIHSWVTSRPIDNTGKLEFEVGYLVRRQPQPRSVSFEDFADGGELSEENKQNVIEFDYLYTGNNTDIIEFDIKMNMGIVYLQGMTIANPYKNPGEKIPNNITTTSAQDINLRWNGNNIPVFFGTQLKTASIRDTYDGLTSAQHAYSMSKHASLEVMEASVRIMGNSQLLGSINRTSNPDGTKTLGPINLDDGFSRFAQWTLVPSFAKINIKMPRNNDDVALFTGSQTSEDDSDSADYAVDFWFTGYYYVYGVEHIFENGEFYQILQALGIPEKNSFKVEQQKTQTRDLELDKKVMACYDQSANFGCNGQPDSSSADVVYYPLDPSATSGELYIPTVDPRVLKNIENVDRWSSASPTVKDAILRASANHGVDPSIMAAMARVESVFSPTASTRKSSAKGLFQFIDSTWRSYGNGKNQFDPHANADAGARFMADNIRYLNKRGISNPDIYNIYMAHNQGPGVAAEVQQLINSGRGHEVPRSASVTNLNNNGIYDHSANGIMSWTKRFINNKAYSGKHIPVIPSNNNTQSNTNAVDNEISPQNQPLTNKQVLSNTFNCGEDQPLQSTTSGAPTGCSQLPGVEFSPIDNSRTPTGQLNESLANLATSQTTGISLLGNDVVKNANQFNNEFGSSLRIKSSEALAGGHTKRDTIEAAAVVQNKISGVNRFTAFDDEYHHHVGYHSQHVEGNAFDFTVNPGENPSIIALKTRHELEQAGYSVQVLNEYANPSIKATGKHIHVTILGKKTK